MEKTLSASDILSYMDGGARLYRGSGDSKVELHMPGMSLKVIVPPFVFYALVAEGKIKPEGASAAGYYNKEHCRHYATASVQMSASKVFKPTDLPESNSSGYPAPFRDGQRKRWNRRLADYGGLKNFGVNFVRVEPGGQSSARHAHTRQDEFVYIIEGEFILVTDAGRQIVRPGSCIAFPASWQRHIPAGRQPRTAIRRSILTVRNGQFAAVQ